ncbi:helix-turn-helix domain-containing protein [Aliikangiella maris]|uniref:Helix-turn-helix domain-containing protein n=2 Tax=Aliikangiella maris TaxID=3162458 RepID=A0ABV2BUP8_9GAMM
MIIQHHHNLNSNEAPFKLVLFKPKGALSAYVQCIWFASVTATDNRGLYSGEQSVKRWLAGDGCGGILFSLNPLFCLNQKIYRTNILLLPVSKHSQKIELLPGCQLAGIRFQPGVSFSLFGSLFDKPIMVTEQNDSNQLNELFFALTTCIGFSSVILKIYQWCNQQVAFEALTPKKVINAIQYFQNSYLTNDLTTTNLPLSLRQIERQFSKRIGLTPVQFKRLLRVKNCWSQLKFNPQVDLSELALQCGFSDQAHMINEFKRFAEITPGRLSQLLLRR